MDKKRPGRLTTVIIVGIVLGSLGTCGGLTSIVSLAFQDQMQEMSRQIAEMSAQGNRSAFEQQLVMQERMNELNEEWRGALFSHQFVNLLASILLLGGAIQLLRWKAKGLTIFTVGAVASILADGGGAVIAILYQLEIGAVLQEYMAGLTSDPALAGAERTLDAIGTASTRAGMFIGAAWAAVKIGAYAYAVVLVRKPAIRTLFQRE